MSGRYEKDTRLEEKINRILKSQPILVREYANSFGSKTSSTKNVYLNHAISFLKYLKDNYDIDCNRIYDLKKLNYSHVTSYMNYTKSHMPDGTIIKKEAITCATELFAIKHFCKFLFLCRYIDHNPCEYIEIPKDKKQREIISLNPEEINTIKENILKGVGSGRAKAYQADWKNRDLCIVLLGIGTGLRVSAISNIDIKDINFKDKTIRTIEKGSFERIVYLSDKLIETIHEWMKDRERLLKGEQCDALFISARKTRISTNTIRCLLDKYTYNIPKRITPHKLRSTTATNLYDETGDIYLVADVLGHHNIQNTRRYAKVSEDKRKYAAEKLSSLL